MPILIGGRFSVGHRKNTLTHKTATAIADIEAKRSDFNAPSPFRVIADFAHDRND
jgi:hypothetical protein